MDLKRCLQKQDEIKHLLAPHLSPQARYAKIIELGSQLPAFNPEWKTDENLVRGCQSLMYLKTLLSPDGQALFYATSDALISKGLAYLLIHVYHEEPPQAIFSAPPLYLKEVGLDLLLSPGRSNGLASLLLRMKQDLLKFDKIFILD